MKLSIAKILERTAELPDRQDKINFLQSNNSVPLLTILKYALDPTIEWLLPKGRVPYKPCPFADQEGMLYSEARRLYLFVKGGNDNLKQYKREILFIQLLESLCPEDAALLVAAKDKKLPYKSLTPKLINAAFPGLITEREKVE